MIELAWVFITILVVSNGISLGLFWISRNDHRYDIQYYRNATDTTIKSFTHAVNSMKTAISDNTKVLEMLHITGYQYFIPKNTALAQENAKKEQESVG